MYSCINAHKVEIWSGRGVDLENPEGLLARIAQRVWHPGRDEDDLPLADLMGHSVGHKLADAADHDVDVVCLAVPVVAAARTAREQSVMMEINGVRAETGVDQTDLLAPPVVQGRPLAVVKGHNAKQRKSPPSEAAVA